MESSIISMKSIVSNLSDLVEKNIISYIDVISSNYNLERSELVRIWNEDIQTVVRVSKKETIKLSDGKKVCQYKFQKNTKTKNAGEICGAVVRKEGVEYCSKHIRQHCEVFTDNEDGSDKKMCEYKYKRMSGKQCNHVAMKNSNFCALHKNTAKRAEEKKLKTRDLKAEREAEREDRRKKSGSKKNKKSKKDDEEPEFPSSDADVSSDEPCDSDSDIDSEEEVSQENVEVKEPEVPKAPVKEPEVPKAPVKEPEVSKKSSEHKKDRKSSEHKKDKSSDHRKSSEHKKDKSSDHRKSSGHKKTKERPPIDRDETEEEADLKDD